MNAKKWVKENVVCLPKSLDELTTLLEVHHVDVSEEEAEERYKKAKQQLAKNLSVTINLFNQPHWKHYDDVLRIASGKEELNKHRDD